MCAFRPRTTLGFKGSSGGPYVVKDSSSGRSLLSSSNSSENAGSVDGFGGLLVFRAILVTADTTICARSEEHTSELQSRLHLVCRLLLETKNSNPDMHMPERA